MSDTFVTRSRAAARQTQAHSDSVRESIAEVAKFMVDLLGGNLLAECCGVEPSTISRWASGESTPNLDNERRLRVAYQVARMLLETDSDYTVRAWFIGLNPLLDDVTPSQALADGRYRETLSAGRLFAEM